MALWSKRKKPRSTQGTRLAEMTAQSTSQPSAEYQAALNQLEPNESIALVTSAGLMHGNRILCQWGRAFLTNRRVLYIGDGGRPSMSMDLLRRKAEVLTFEAMQNDFIAFDNSYQIVVPKQESATFLSLVRTFADEFDRPQGWYQDPGDETQSRYWDGDRWTPDVRPIEDESPTE